MARAQMLSMAIMRRLCSSTSFTSAATSEPTILRIKNGNLIPYPRGSKDEIKAHDVYEYGEKAVEQFIHERNHLDKLHNQAKLRYLEMRHQLLQNFRGKWVAVNPQGSIIIAANENLVRQMAELVFPFRFDEYHADCVGCEILRGVVMDNSPLNGDENAEINDDVEFVMPKFLSSAVSPKKEIFVRAEHSFDGQNFKPYLMKHHTGAAMMGIPFEVLATPPAGVSLERGTDLRYIGPSGRRDVMRTYNNNYIRVAGLTIKVPVIESRVWLLGYPILSRFRNIIDVKAKEVVTLEPLS
jgi:hypothetical protein